MPPVHSLGNATAKLWYMPILWWRHKFTFRGGGGFSTYTGISLCFKLYYNFVHCYKELIQNADDAQATKVGFLIDWREHPTNDVMFSKFDQYQGPALYAWNNTVFKDNDWKSLGKINQSSKEEDVLKVGRFGLGFQSVFHITGMYVANVASFQMSLSQAKLTNKQFMTMS